MIVEIVEDQRQGIRQALEAGLQAGANPRQTALGIVGRINRATGKREGGLIGLTSQQMGYVANAKAELADPDQMAGYLQRGLRDKRYDRLVAKAIRDGKPLAKVDIDRIAARYADRLLKWRGDMIARTESIGALHAGQYEAMRQLIDSGKVRADQVTKTWSATMDGRTRDSHQAMNGQTVSFDRPFVTPSGYLMRYPHDAEFGAPADEIIGCRCFMNIKIKYL